MHDGTMDDDTMDDAFMDDGTTDDLRAWVRGESGSELATRLQLIAPAVAAQIAEAPVPALVRAQRNGPQRGAAGLTHRLPCQSHG